jgi:hemerythrin-like domain-containing protein
MILPLLIFCSRICGGSLHKYHTNLDKKIREGIHMRKMMPIGPLMIEHRLIEKMIAVMKKNLKTIEEKSHITPGFIETTVDFIRTYADRCHHGKEEDILFRELKKKTLSPQHRKIMEELIEEHVWGRKATKALLGAYTRSRQGNAESLSDVAAHLKALVDLYPEHIEKEDRHFFRPVMEYFTQEERDAMLEEGFAFDQKLIHEKYKDIVTNAEKMFSP